MAMKVVGVLTEKATARVGETTEWLVGEGHISPESPNGKLLCGARVGDEITLFGSDETGLNEFPIRVTQVHIV